MMDESTLKEALAVRTCTRPEDWYLAFRTRHAMLVVMQALREQRGPGEVVTQLFTCCTAVDPIVSSGLVSVYGDIDPDTLALDPACLPLGASTRAVVAQHTFGIVDDASTQALVEAAHGAGALLLEDSAHCACRLARDAHGEPLADVSFHSFGVGKMATSGFGGAVWINPLMGDGTLAAALRDALDALPAFDARLERATKSYGLSIRVLMHLPRPVRRALWDRLAAARLFVPAVSSAERRGELSFEPMRLGDFGLEDMRKGFDSLDGEEERSRKACEVFLDALAPLVDELGIPRAARMPGAPLLQLPLVLGDEAQADGLIEELCRQGCYCEAWGRPLLFPGALDEAAYRMPADLGSLPATQRISAGIVPLLTCVAPADALKAARIVVDHLF